MTVVSAESLPQQFSVSNPVTGESIGTVPVLDRAAVEAAGGRARATQPGWEALGAQARGRLLRKWADAIWTDRERLMALIRRETGKSESSALLEVAALDNIATYYARQAARILRPQRRGTVFPLIQR